MARARRIYRTAPTGPAAAKAAPLATTLAATGCVTPRNTQHVPENDISGWFNPTEEGFVTLYQAPALTHVGWVKSGVGARDAKTILGQLRVPQGDALAALHIPVATVNRKARTNARLSPAEGERVLGLGRLIGQLQTMVRESGNPDGFDAAAWLSAWMSAPAPSLGGARPLDLMDTMTGQALVGKLLSQMQSGAYA